MSRILHTGKLRNMTSIYLRSGDQILLLYRQGNSIVTNLWIGSAGGHFEVSELNDAKSCVLRELYEELGIQKSQIKNLSLRYITLRYTDDEIRQNYYFFADLDTESSAIKQSTEGELMWFSQNDLASLPMPFTARFMIDHYISVGQYNDCLYGGIADKETVTFIKL